MPDMPSSSPSPGAAPSSPSHMRREIEEQPAALAATLEALLPLREDIRALRGGRRQVLFNARGSSGNAALYGRYLLEARCGVLSGSLAPSVVTHYEARLDLRDAVVVSVSQSGQTEEIVATQRWAAEQGAATIAIANHADSPLVAQADLALVTRAGVEQAVPATKSYTTQLAAVAVLASALAQGDAVPESALRAVPAAVAEVIARALEPAPGGGPSPAEAMAAELASREGTVVTGRGIVMGTALEVALKVEETCLRTVRGYSYADLRHGPIAAVDAGEVAVLVAAQDGPMVAPMTALAADLRERGTRLVGLGGDDAFAAAVDVHLPGPDLPEELAPLGLVVPAQLGIERLSHVLGLDPDAPSGLRKVTRTDRPG